VRGLLPSGPLDTRWGTIYPLFKKEFSKPARSFDTEKSHVGLSGILPLPALTLVLRYSTLLGSAHIREVLMRRIAILAGIALAIGIGAVWSLQKAPTPMQTAGPCESTNCALPEPAPVRTAGPCESTNCALPEPAPVRTAAPCEGNNCAVPTPAPVQTAEPCGG